MGPPLTFRQNETPTWTDGPWTDENGLTYQSPANTLTTIFAGPSTGPVALAGTPAAGGWTTSLDAVSSAKLVPGKYWWQAVLTAASFRRVIREGQVTVETDLALVGSTGNYDGRTTAEKALANWEAAFSALSGGTTKAYVIGSRQMTFQDLKEIAAAVDYWRARVAQERSAACGGKDRLIQQRFYRG